MKIHTRYSRLDIGILAICNETEKFKDKQYVNAEISAITGLSNRQVKFYTDKLVIPVSHSKGRGSFNKYSKDNLFEFFIINELWEFGITINKIREVLDHAQSIYAGYKGK